MLQLFTKKEVFQGNDEIHQLDVIYKIFGTLTAERWAGVADLPWFELVKVKDTIPNSFRTLFQKSVWYLCFTNSSEQPADGYLPQHST
jgi:CTD kinase subunit alpha